MAEHSHVLRLMDIIEAIDHIRSVVDNVTLDDVREPA